MALGFPISWASQQNYVLASGSLLGELVPGEDLTAVCEHTLSGLFSKPEGADVDSLGESLKPDIVCDGADDGHCFVFELADVLGNAGERNGVTVESGLVETLVDDFVESAVSPAGEERVKLGKEGCTLMRDLR
mgnify:CR=1 FL=1